MADEAIKVSPHVHARKCVAAFVAGSVAADMPCVNRSTDKRDESGTGRDESGMNDSKPSLHERYRIDATILRTTIPPRGSTPPPCLGDPPMRDARDDWRRFDAVAIPSKESTPRLDAFVQEMKTVAVGRPLTLLDVGCGSGRLSRRLFEQGFSVFGVDINPDAIHAAQHHAAAADVANRSLRFGVADFAEDASPRLDAGPFDVVICQLVISIIGTNRQRMNLLRHVHGVLRPGGRLFLSASGVSDTINAGYARLYADDLPLTGERHTYLSRNERGEVLYMTHHFTPAELTSLLEAAGFDEISVVTEKETSSRRPDEAAFFLYATCRSRP